MTVQGVLIGTGVPADGGAFKKFVRDLFESMFPGWTDEDLLDEPAAGERFCAAVRKRCGDDSLDDVVVTGALQNFRKAGGNPFGKGRPPLRMGEALGEAGCGMDRDTFYEHVADLFNGLYRDRTGEEMKRRPREAGKFCRALRRRIDCPRLPDRVILHALTDMRKHPSSRGTVR